MAISKYLFKIKRKRRIIYLSENWEKDWSTANGWQDLLNNDCSRTGALFPSGYNWGGLSSASLGNSPPPPDSGDTPYCYGYGGYNGSDKCLAHYYTSTTAGVIYPQKAFNPTNTNINKGFYVRFYSFFSPGFIYNYINNKFMYFGGTNDINGSDEGFGSRIAFFVRPPYFTRAGNQTYDPTPTAGWDATRANCYLHIYANTDGHMTEWAAANSYITGGDFRVYPNVGEVTVTSQSGSFVENEELTFSSAGTVARFIEQNGSTILFRYKMVVNTYSGSPRIHPPTEPTAAETITGATSGATCTISSLDRTAFYDDVIEDGAGWNCYEFYAKTNPVDNEWGAQYRAWINGNLVTDVMHDNPSDTSDPYGRLSTRTVGDYAALNGLYVHGYYGGGVPSVPTQNQYRLTDEIVVSDDYVGPL